MARPKISPSEYRTRIARAVYFIVNNTSGNHSWSISTHNIKRLSGVRTEILNDPFIIDMEWVTKKLPYLYRNRSKIVLSQGWATPYSPNGVAERCDKTLNVLHWYSSTFTFTPLQEVLGYLKYPLNLTHLRLSDLRTTDGSIDVQPAFSVMTMLTLRKYGLLNPLSGTTKSFTLAESVVRLYWDMTLRDGRIHHSRRSIRNLQIHDKDNIILHRGEGYKCDGLFHRKHGTGNVAHGSYKYMLSRKGESFFRDVTRLFTDLLAHDTAINVNASDITVSNEQLSLLHDRDRVILLSRTIGSNNGNLVVKNNINDNGVTRSYNLMTMLTSDGRKTLGYKQIDANAMLQSIVMEMVPDAESSYPVHAKLVLDKKSLRNRIAVETGRDIAWVKTSLSKIDNGGTIRDELVSKSPLLNSYIKESRAMVPAFMDAITDDNKRIAFSLTHTPSEELMREKWMQNDISNGKRYTDGKKVFGVFFHAWTQIERIVRDIIKSRINGYCHDVHDAVATRSSDYDIDDINNAIREYGFNYISVDVS